MRWMVIVGLVALGACAQTPKERAASERRAVIAQDKLEDALAGLVPGKPTTCMNSFSRSQLSAYGPVLLYTVTNSLKYRSDTNGGCEGVARGDILVTRSNQGRLCQGDIAQTIDQASRFPTGSCAIGPFTPYRKP